MNECGASTVQVQTAGVEKQSCTVMLAVTDDGHKLIMYTIFKRKILPKEKLPSGIVVRVQQNGWMTEDLFMEWLKTVWFRRPGALLRPRSMLIIDSFRVHLTDSVKEKCQKEKCDMVVIPGGMMGMLQPLDVSINRPFKANLRHL